jgi:hypothetical protein
MFLLRSYRPDRYGEALDRLLARREAEDEDYSPEDPGVSLDGGLSGIEFGASDVPPDEADDDEPFAL